MCLSSLCRRVVVVLLYDGYAYAPRRKCLTRCPKVDRRATGVSDFEAELGSARASKLCLSPTFSAARSDRVRRTAQPTMAPTVLSVRATAEEALVQATAN